MESTNNNKQTALHLSVQQGYFDITKKLIEKGALITAQDDEKNNILHLGALNGHLELLKYLLEKSPLYLIKEKNIFNQTPKDVGKDQAIIKVLSDFLLVNSRKMSINTDSRLERIQIFETTGVIDLTKKSIRQPKENKYSHSSSKNSDININISTNIENLNHIVNNINTLPSNKSSSKKFKRDKSPINFSNTLLNAYGSNKNLINPHVSKEIPTASKEFINQTSSSITKGESNFQSKISNTPNTKLQQEIRSKDFFLNALSSEPSLNYVRSTEKTVKPSTKLDQLAKKVEKSEKVPTTQINLMSEPKSIPQKINSAQISLSGKSCELVDYENMSTKKFKIGGALTISNKISITPSSKAFLGIQPKKEVLTAKNTTKNLIYKEIDLYCKDIVGVGAKKTNLNDKKVELSKEKSKRPYITTAIRTAQSPIKKRVSKSKISIDKLSKDETQRNPKVSRVQKDNFDKINTYSSINNSKVERQKSKNETISKSDNITKKNTTTILHEEYNRKLRGLKSQNEIPELNISDNKVISDEDSESLNRAISTKTEDKDLIPKKSKSDNNNDSSNPEEKILPSSFVCHALIGKGSFGEVYLVEKISNSNLYAMKVLSKDKIMGQNLVKYAMTERNVLSFMNHPFIVKLKYAFQTVDRLFLILDYCPGGDLAEHITFEKKFNEDKAKFYLCQIILALEHLHKRDIIFRDLKPDNVVLDSDGNSYLTDFGLSKEGVMDNIGAKSFCGSIAYLAPEMLKRAGHGKSVDWYLLGVIFYEMLAGEPPFFTDNK